METKQPIVQIRVTVSHTQGAESFILNYEMHVKDVEETNMRLRFEKNVATGEYEYVGEANRLNNILMYFYKQKYGSRDIVDEKVIEIKDDNFTISGGRVFNFTYKVFVESAEHMQGTLVSVTAEAVSSGEEVAA